MVKPLRKKRSMPSNEVAVITTTSRSGDATTLNATTQRVMTSDVVLPEDEAATLEEAVVEDVVPTTQHDTLQPSVTTVEDPTHTKEDNPSVLPTTLSVTNEVVHPHHVWKTPTEGVAAAIGMEITVEDDATYTAWSMETNSWLKRQCRNKLQANVNNAKAYTP